MKFIASFAGHRRSKQRWRATWPVALLMICGAMAGCQSAPPHASIVGPGYRANNVVAHPPKLSRDIRRVAILPLSPETSDGSLADGCAVLSSVLWQELIKTKKFELVGVDAEALRIRTGRMYWTGAENLPPDFFAFFRREYDCDAVLFADLTAYRGYAPLAVGWRLKLVDARSGEILWAADEMFDASRARVARGLQRFGQPPVIWPFFHEDNWLALNSPRQLGHYSAAAVLNTLPER